MAPLLCLIALVVAGCSPDHYPQTALRPISDFGRIGDDIRPRLSSGPSSVFILVEGALLYAIFRFRGKPGSRAVSDSWQHDRRDHLDYRPGAHSGRHRRADGARHLPDERHPRGRSTRSPGDRASVVVGVPLSHVNVTTANELHIPVGQNRLSLKMEHGRHGPQLLEPAICREARRLSRPRDTTVVQGRRRRASHPAQCAEFCGIQHGRMAFRVVAQTAEEFKTWGAHMQTLKAQPMTPPPPAPPPAAGTRENRSRAPPAPPEAVAAAPSAAGEKLCLLSKGCVWAYHALNAYEAPKGMIGPNLANVGARTYIGASTIENTDENLARWIHEPAGHKERCAHAQPRRQPGDGQDPPFPSFALTDEQGAYGNLHTRPATGPRGRQHTGRRPASGAGSRRSTTSASASSTVPPPSSSS